MKLREFRLDTVLGKNGLRNDVRQCWVVILSAFLGVLPVSCRRMGSMRRVRYCGVEMCLLLILYNSVSLCIVRLVF